MSSAPSPLAQLANRFKSHLPLPTMSLGCKTPGCMAGRVILELCTPEPSEGWVPRWVFTRGRSMGSPINMMQFFCWASPGIPTGAAQVAEMVGGGGSVNQLSSLCSRDGRKLKSLAAHFPPPPLPSLGGEKAQRPQLQKDKNLQM